MFFFSFSLFPICLSHYHQWVIGRVGLVHRLGPLAWGNGGRPEPVGGGQCRLNLKFSDFVHGRSKACRSRSCLFRVLLVFYVVFFGLWVVLDEEIKRRGNRPASLPTNHIIGLVVGRTWNKISWLWQAHKPRSGQQIGTHNELERAKIVPAQSIPASSRNRKLQNFDSLFLFG